MAPELIHNQAKQSPLSDIYSAGGILTSIDDYMCLNMLSSNSRNEYIKVAAKRRSIHPHLRPSAEEAMLAIQNLTI